MTQACRIGCRPGQTQISRLGSGGDRSREDGDGEHPASAVAVLVKAEFLLAPDAQTIDRQAHAAPVAV